MGKRQTRQIRWMARGLTGAGAALLVIGALLGWVAPLVRAAQAPWLPVALLADLRAPLASANVDVSGFLGADITALAVIIAVVIGFNATTLQIAGQTHSLSLVRALLWSLTPFFLCWSLTTAVALVYFLQPPTYVAQFWQVLVWFGAVVLLMIGYVWELPWRVSGEYAGSWSIRSLRGQPIARWENLDGYWTLQTAVAAASARGDLGTVATISRLLGRFLAAVRDSKAELENTYNRGRYRALKNLLSGCAQNAASAPNAVAYHLGMVQAGILLQAVALGIPLDDPEHDFYSGLFRAVRPVPDRFNPLFTGLRHAICRGTDGMPYLVEFWLARPKWTVDDPRRAAKIGDALARAQAACWRELRASVSPGEADAEATEMLVDLYRDIATHLAPVVARERRRLNGARPGTLVLGILDTAHTAALRLWPANVAEERRVAVVNAYEVRHKELLLLFKELR
ncbi:MAG: hypothetical protein OJF49_000622 [Ktedonobacterales bacterium]|jgi:hypothetical protein|nr:MAG: hypothetical protein OJF49_000622 [Ktedonobacterales bacterium]